MYRKSVLAIGFTSAIGMMVWVLAGQLLAAPLPRDTGKGNYLPLVEGHEWTFRDSSDETFTVSVKEVRKDGANRTVATLNYSYEGGDFSEPMAMDEAGVYRPRPGEEGFTRPVAVLKYPLEVGRTWDSQIPLAGGSIPAKATVRRVVDVKVPAGTFRAVEVEFVATEELKASLTAWYAPGVGVVKQQTVGPDGHRTIELVEFKPGK